MTIYTAETIATGIHFGEGPRWRDGKLFFSDFYAHKVFTLDPATKEVNEYLELPNKGQPSGLGWLPDGRMVVVSMLDKKLLVREQDGTLKEYADLSAFAGYHCNDMVVSADGNCYVGNFGFDLDKAIHEHGVEWVLANATPANVIRVSPDQKVSVGAPGMLFPNGSQITPDGKTLIVGETLGMRLTAFDIEADGSLSNRRVWANTPGVPCDGSCLDAEGAIWVANPFSNSVSRFAEGGKVLATCNTSQPTFACMLGGPDRKDLFILTAPDSDHERRAGVKEGKIEVARVDVAGAGLP